MILEWGKIVCICILLLCWIERNGTSFTKKNYVVETAQKSEPASELVTDPPKDLPSAFIEHETTNSCFSIIYSDIDC